MGFLNISFFKTPEHRVFHYEPRYYDPQKEQLQKIYEKYGKNPDGTPKVQGTEAEAEYNKIVSTQKHIPGESIRGSFQSAYKESRRSAGNHKIKTIITIIALILAFVAAYYLADSLVYLLGA